MTTQQLAPPKNSLALASVILGIIAAGVGLLFGLTGYGLDPLRIMVFIVITAAPSLLAIIFGFIGISTANRLAGERRALAIWGVILGVLPLLTLVLGNFLRTALFGAT